VKPRSSEEKRFFTASGRSNPCFIHDTSEAAAEIIREAFSEEGKSGRKLTQFG